MLNEIINLDLDISMEEILFFLKIVIGDRVLTEKDIHSLCEHMKGIRIHNVSDLIVYCVILKLAEKKGKFISLSLEAKTNLGSEEILNEYIVKKTIKILFDNDIFRPNLFSYDVHTKCFSFKNEELPLKFSAIKNLLIRQGFFDVDRENVIRKFYVNEKYVHFLGKYCKNVSRKITLKELYNRLKKNNIVGELAERFVLEFEMKRLQSSPRRNLIKRISDIDVCAGFDIVSFHDETSIEYDRFIEVKAIPNEGSFYWSKNEIERAEELGEDYYLYLVHLNRIKDSSYNPIMISNPAVLIKSSGEWLMESQSYRIRHI